MKAIENLGVSGRVLGVLERGGITDLDELLVHNERQLLALPGFGPACLDEVWDVLDEHGLELPDDPYGPYVCARHGAAARDASLATFLLCQKCSNLWQKEAFDGQEAEWIGDPVGGYCLNCNIERPDACFRQWFLCGVCERVARSIGRSVVAERFIRENWEESIAPEHSDLTIENVDVPTLRRRVRDPSTDKRAEVDFVVSNAGGPLFGIEMKSGRSHVPGVPDAVGSPIGQFQLDTSDCDDILAVMRRDGVPVYLMHVQVIDRAQPPSVRYVALAAWWTDVFEMKESFITTAVRPRETRTAAYYDTAMFRDFSTFRDHLTARGPEQVARRIKREGIPELY